jgi:predicted glycoside hydrolase/deacetylase ChbG (UPF0249 family)
MKIVSICADDFGISKKINKGILQCVKNRRVTEVSCVVCSELRLKDFYFLKKFKSKSKIGIGIHIVLTDFNFNLDKKSFKLPDYRTFLFSLNKIANKNYFEYLIEAQLDKFFSIFKQYPDFIDGHKHVHQFPQVFAILDKILKKKKINKKYWIRNTHNKYIFSNLSNFSIKCLILSLFGRNFKRNLTSLKYNTNQNFLGIYYYKKKKKFRNIFSTFLKKIDHKNLIMVHPGFTDYSIFKFDDLIERREDELNYLLSKSFLKDINYYQILIRKYKI